ncbi:unnamed protein product [Camellia sinensis]
MEGDNGDCYYEWGDKIESLILADDDESLISFMTSPPFADGRLGIDPKNVIDGYHLLHHAIMSSSYDLAQLFLHCGARTDITCLYHLNKAYDGMIPLELALYKVSREALAMYKLVAGFTRDVEELAYHCATEGKLVELAVLLVVAREKVLVPITFHGNNGAVLNGSMTIHECLKNQFVSLINEDINLMGQVKHEKLTQIHNKKTIMKLAMVLLEVFERAGNSIEEYHQLQLQQPDREHMEKDVSLRLVEASFNLKAGDFDFSIRDWIKDKSSQLWSPRLPMQQQTNAFFPPRKEIPVDGLDVQVKKRMKAIEHNGPKCLSREKFVYTAIWGNSKVLDAGAWRPYKSVESGRLPSQMRRLLQLLRGLFTKGGGLKLRSGSIVEWRQPPQLEYCGG